MSAGEEALTGAASARPRAVAVHARPGSILRALGVLCLVAALALGGSIGWLLWGTGLSTARAQRDLRAQFDQILRHPVTVPAAQAPPVVHFRLGQAVAIVRIPRIHLDMVVVEGTNAPDLRKGPGHYVGTAYPWSRHGRVAIAGHRTTYLHPFWGIDRLRPGDLVELRTKYGTFDYRVTQTLTVLPSASWVLRQTRSPTLVLTTCTPRFSASHRLVVFAALA
jgi:sortase A